MDFKVCKSRGGIWLIALHLKIDTRVVQSKDQMPTQSVKDSKLQVCPAGNFIKVTNKVNNRSSHLESFVIDVLVSSLLVCNASVRERRHV